MTASGPTIVRRKLVPPDNRPVGVISIPAWGAGLAGAFVFLLTKSVPYAVGIVLGPLAGGVARGGQSCCLEVSLQLLPFGLAALGVGFACLLAARESRRFSKGVRTIGWAFGWLVWFALGLLSYAHALE